MYSVNQKTMPIPAMPVSPIVCVYSSEWGNSPHWIDVGVFSLELLYLILKTFQARQLLWFRTVTAAGRPILFCSPGCFKFPFIRCHLHGTPASLFILGFATTAINGPCHQAVADVPDGPRRDFGCTIELVAAGDERRGHFKRIANRT